MRLVSTRCMEFSEAWLTGRKYLAMELEEIKNYNGKNLIIGGQPFIGEG